MTATARRETPTNAEPATAPLVRLLYIYPDTMGPAADPRRNALFHLSRYFAGDMVAVWGAGRKGMPQHVPGVSDTIGRFRFRWTPATHPPTLWSKLAELRFLISTGLRLSREEGRYDLIVTYGPFWTALAGVAVKRLTGSRLIVEFPGNPTRGMAHGGSGLGARLKRWLAPKAVELLAGQADHLRLLYPSQLADLPALTRRFNGRISTFHDFVPVQLVRGAAPSGKYVLFLGYPWRLKGVDVLIAAWKMVSPKFPDYTLKIVGHCPDRTEWEALRAGDPTIEFHKAVPNPEAMKLLAGASMFVLPSRTEAMGRVLLEAMAARKPIVASRVDGIPAYVDHEHTGLLFESENAADLAAQMERVLGDPALAERLTERAFEHVHGTLSEAEYVERFREMAVRALRA